MNVLFVHQNFPGQFRHVAAALAASPAHRVVALGQGNQVQSNGFRPPGLTPMGYPQPEGAGAKTHHYLQEHEQHVRRGQAVVRALGELATKQGFQPDVVVAHPGWGEALFLKDIFPKAKHIYYFEYFYNSTGGDVGFDPELPFTADDRLRVRIKNNTQLQALVACDQGISPTPWQRSRYPEVFQPRIQVMHEGVDTTRLVPKADAVFTTPSGVVLSRQDKVVTYVARNLEPYRGFHVLMRSLQRLQQLQPDAHVVVVGNDGVSYGRAAPGQQTYKTLYQAEVQDQVDWSRVHFTGKLPYERYVQVLQVSSVHLYLTYPFVLSWSMLEAMACGCVVVGSDTAPVRDVIRPGDNGLLVDFFDTHAWAQTVSDTLNNPALRTRLSAQARADVVERFDLQTVCLPKMLRWMQDQA